ncbi:sensor of ECF-type sigma factor [Aquimarina muelleri]|uniref:sensor of ECF-type sigma factor n=1 Tax=Aquimarina muelleri TaxID=279356 RepID=UPI003F6850F1
MKKIILLIYVIFIYSGIFAQNGSREKIKAFKIAYITEKLNLSSKEAQEFWPIYNNHEEIIENLRKEKRKLMKALKEADDSENITDKRAEDFINQYLESEEKKSKAKKNLILDLKKSIPNKKIIKLIKAERDFHKRMLDRIKGHRKKH